MRFPILPALAILLIAGLTACSGESEQQSAEPLTEEQKIAAMGEDVYNKFCFSCHAAGIAGAPITGDADAWSWRADKGMDQLLTATVEGIDPGMPPMGLCTICSEEELKAAITYMLNASK